MHLQLYLLMRHHAAANCYFIGACARYCSYIRIIVVANSKIKLHQYSDDYCQIHAYNKL